VDETTLYMRKETDPIRLNIRIRWQCAKCKKWEDKESHAYNYIKAGYYRQDED